MRGVIGGNTEGMVTAGGFAYDEATLTDLIKEWLDLADDYNRSFRDSQRLVGVRGPGLDFASEAVAVAAKSFGHAYLNYLRQNSKYCVDQAQSCQNALDDYLEVERRNVATLHSSGRSEEDNPI
ncbi:hypothetical protein [Actinophytocola glycyrrhizae]|uniref:Excreted virulence factor EspC (Type VII ESX diderm) n=1 Tax=Actinophytocola glycyrrhizae TaxID=2044873 RepID=A0ABV9S8U5_9PSEU